jgi:hypothetical protein
MSLQVVVDMNLCQRDAIPRLQEQDLLSLENFPVAFSGSCSGLRTSFSPSSGDNLGSQRPASSG